MMTTNREWAVPAGNRARRFLVLDASQDKVGDYAYFKALWHEVNNGGIEAFLHLLLNVPVSDDDLRAVPRTEALRRQQLQSANSMTQWGADAASSGELVLQGGPTPQPGGGFGVRQPAKALYIAYAGWCMDMRHRPVSKTEFAHWLASLGFQKTVIKGTAQYVIPDARTFAAAVLRKAGIV